MKLSIIITHYKTPNLLTNCIESILTYVKGIEYEVIVVDSGAEFSTQVLMEEKFSIPNIHYVPFNENVGYGYSVNRGLKKAEGEFILIINADILLRDEHSLPLLITYLDEHTDVGLIAGKLFNIDDTIQQSFFREPTLSALFARRTGWRNTRWGRRALDYFEFGQYDFKKPLEVDWLMGSCLLTKREAFEKIGYFNEQFFMYFEDVDWARRARFAGYRIIYHPKAVFTHWHIRASRGTRGIFDPFSNLYSRIHIKSYLKYFYKWRIMGLIKTPKTWQKKN